VPCKTAEDASLAQATWRYFRTPSPAGLQALVPTGREHPSREMYRAALMTQAAHAVIDDEYSMVADCIARQGECVTCRAGCSSCCNQAVLAYPFEAALIGLYLANHPAKRAGFLQAFGTWHESTRAMRDDYLDWAERCYRDNTDDGAFRLSDFQAPCPFLSGDLCQIYPVRPYACRAYLAVTEACPRPVAPDQTPGLQGLDVGSFTTYQKARSSFVRIMFRRFGIDPDTTRNRLMPDLVHMFLDRGAAGLLEACLARPVRAAAAAELAA
jgi:Fe-S-cluster containining protein